MTFRPSPGGSIAALALACLAAGLATAAPASSQPNQSPLVMPGQSIQAAIDNAPSGATIRVHAGSYRQNLLITKPLTLVGVGRVVLRPAGRIARNVCTEDASEESSAAASVGVCIVGRLGGQGRDGERTVLEAVANVHLDGVEVSGFTEGVVAYGTRQLHITRVRATDNSDVGIFTGAGSLTYIVGNNANSNGTSGIRIDTSRGVYVRSNTAEGNSTGIGLNADRNGDVSDNNTSGNCTGILIFDTDEPTPTGKLQVQRNHVFRNNRFCPSDGGTPAISGIGIALLGTTAIHATQNTIEDNIASRDPKTGAQPDLGGAGLMLLDASKLTGGDTPRSNVIEHNTLTGNLPLDILWDGSGTGNMLTNNNCSLTNPSTACN
jgi:nitrous oxidase accessory protein NosD